ncbi:cytochrome P450 monooxygenase gliC [Aspergillus candidus]|uniref:Cytochrome p450 monooxygenase GliC n=1 Tax=Aspergillus candidus TaxID=41067 RepID=A0A2I2FND5_ASPCN|nr:cytochrome p450 monooxygenase GliC [Aspergillus candidus]PLB42128.1 cytochrome p450 monooxygenase GliC [Aspergillus candidus]
MAPSIMASQALMVLVVFVAIKFRSSIGNAINKLISMVIKFHLYRRYPVQHVDDKTPLPTLPYQWPDSQGDGAKFLQGQSNSERWEEQLGSIYRLWSGMNPEVVLTRPEHIQAVFKDSHKHLKAKNNNSGYFLGQLLGQCVGLVSQDQWTRVRAIMEKPFHRSTSTAYIPLIRRRTQSFFQELWDTRDLSRGLLDPADDLKLLPFLVVAEIVYGRLAPEIEQELRSLAPQRENLMKYVMKGGLTRFAWSQYLPTQANRELAAFQKKWLAFNERALSSAVKQGLHDAPIVHFFAARDAGELSTAELLHTLDEMLYANLDVTIGGVSWNVVFLAAHRATAAQLRQEIADARSSSVAGDLDAYILSNSTLLAACVEEAARLRPLAAFSVPQAIPTARSVGGYHFPAGTNFVVDSYALNIRNPYWGDNRYEYRPERFLARSPTQARYHFWRFGFGPRQCMGKFVASNVIREILVHLVENYDLGMAKPEAMEAWGRNAEIWINHPDMQVSCVKRG